MAAQRSCLGCHCPGGSRVADPDPHSPAGSGCSGGLVCRSAHQHPRDGGCPGPWCDEPNTRCVRDRLPDGHPSADPSALDLGPEAWHRAGGRCGLAGHPDRAARCADHHRGVSEEARLEDRLRAHRPQRNDARGCCRLAVAVRRLMHGGRTARCRGARRVASRLGSGDTRRSRRPDSQAFARF